MRISFFFLIALAGLFVHLLSWVNVSQALKHMSVWACKIEGHTHSPMYSAKVDGRLPVRPLAVWLGSDLGFHLFKV